MTPAPSGDSAVKVPATPSADAPLSESGSTTEPGSTTESGSTPESGSTTEPRPSYVKLAMRNMVRKSGKSLFHFALTTIGLMALLVGLAYLTR